MALGFRQRILFPVRSNFFYANFLGFIINGILSGFAMYPPMFRDRKRSHLNMLGLNDAVWLLRSGGHLLGFHPEGTRNTGDPYSLLPARSGIGHLVRHAQVRVIPVFTNGLPVSDPFLQLKYNLLRSGPQIHTVFGSPIDFGSLLNEDANPALYKKIADKTRDAIAELALEEREIRANYESGQSSS
jgi:1-acyl-sn-glycerol-3-phosphate acyltransferase